MNQDKRFAPANKLALHTQFSAYLRGERVYPINVEISPCGICNASCEFCFYANTGELGHHRNVMLDTDKIHQIIRECRGMGVKSISWTGGGEPSLHHDIDDVVEYANTCELQQGIFTNALASPRYDPALMEWIRVTITDKPIRPEYIKLLRPCKTVGIAFNYSGSQDDAMLIETLQVADDCGVDYVQLRPALRFHGETVDITPPDITHRLLHVTGYKFEDAKHKHGYKTCEAYKFVPFIWEDGNVSVCSYMRKHGQAYVLGNIYSNTLKEILDAAPASVPVISQCQVCCRNHEHNKSIHAARALEDVNFP